MDPVVILKELDEICGRLDRLAEQLTHPAFSAQREEQAAAEVVQAIQRIGELIAWAYGQHSRLGEAFAQPFVDRRLRDRLKAMLVDRRHTRRELHNRIAAQVLQTIHILLQATPVESTLFCNLTAGWYLNEVVAARLDFRDNEDLLPLWMTVVKDIATMVNKENMMLFFDPSSANPFPIFTEAMRYYHHPVSQVRTHVQATSLEIFLKLRDEDLWGEPLFHLVVSESSCFFTHVCCLLREFWRMADEAARTGNKRDLRSALYIQNDILMYINDVFACDIPMLNEIMQEKLLRFAVIPVLMRSVVLRRPSVAARSPPAELQQSGLLSSPVAFYLLHDLLCTLRSSAVFEAAACIFLRSELPDEVLQLISVAAPRTPTLYFSLQASWGATPRRGPFDFGSSVSDELLYAMPPTTLIELLQRRAAPGAVTRGWPLDALEEWLCNVDPAAETAGLAASLLGTCARMLTTMRAAREVLDVAVAERLGLALSQALSVHHQLQWATLAAAFRTLQELAAASDAPAGRSRHALLAPLRERVIGPLASELLHLLGRYGADVQEAWVQEFQEQSATRQASLWELPTSARQRELLESGAAPELPGPSEGRTKCVRVLLGAWQLALSLAGPDKDGAEGQPVPRVSDIEREEAARFQLGVPLHIGNMNRVKCHRRKVPGSSEEEAMYLLPVKAMLVLVRPDGQKPFWAVPVISEPLRCVRLMAGSEKATPLAQIATPGANAAEKECSLAVEVASPQSPLLRAALAAGATGDRLANTLASPAVQGASRLAASPERLATSVPAVPCSDAPGAPGRGSATPVTLSLVFSDERRRRVAGKILAQAKHATLLGMLEALGAFLVEAAGLPSQGGA